MQKNKILNFLKSYFHQKCNHFYIFCFQVCLHLRDFAANLAEHNLTLSKLPLPNLAKTRQLVQVLRGTLILIMCHTSIRIIRTNPSATIDIIIARWS